MTYRILFLLFRLRMGFEDNISSLILTALFPPLYLKICSSLTLFLIPSYSLVTELLYNRIFNFYINKRVLEKKNLISFSKILFTKVYHFFPSINVIH
jgi:hypothetical protein